MSEATQTQTLEQTLNKTDLGHYLYEHRKSLFSVLIAVLIGVTGYLFWKESKKAKALDVSVKVFEFQQGPWSEAKNGKLSEKDLATSFSKLDKEIKESPVMVPLALEMGKFLIDKGALTEAESLLSELNVQHTISAFFVGFQRAAILEKLEKIDEAIGVMEGLLKMKGPMLPAKITLELGRLYLLKGDKNQAKLQFDQVIGTYPNDESAKLAKLYLSQITQ